MGMIHTQPKEKITMYFHLPRSILQMHKLTSTDDDSEMLQKILVRLDKSSATNGHQLIELKHSIMGLDKKTTEDYFEPEVNPNSEHLAEQFIDSKVDFFIPNHIAAQVLKGTKKRVQFIFRLDSEFSATIFARDPREPKSNILQYSFAWYTKDFPDFSHVIPKSDTGSCYNFGLCLKLINDFYSYVKTVGGCTAGNFTVFPAVKDNLSPLKAIIQTDDGELMWVAMPTRI